MKRKAMATCLIIPALAVSGFTGVVRNSSSTETGWRHTKNEARRAADADALRLSEEAWRRGDGELRLHLLEAALNKGAFKDVVRLELAEMLQEQAPGRAVDLVTPLLRSAPTREMKEGAFEILERAADSGLAAVKLRDLRERIPHRSRNFRRRLEVLTADPGRNSDRRRLDHAISKRSSDLPALQAARKLLQLDDLSAEEQLHVAEALYRHALYSEAAPILENLSAYPGSKARLSKAAYLLGRCLFRQGDYSTARSWYLRALKASPDAETRASLEVHIARCSELEGDLNQAILYARRAVLSRSSDARRLFLAKLRLRTHRPDLAALGISRIRSSSKRSRGTLMMALFSLAAGKNDEGLKLLRGVSSSSWKGPAGVLQAEIHLEEKQSDAALEVLRRSSGRLNNFWTWRARLLMERLPREVLEKWRGKLRIRSQDRSPSGLRALREWAILEFEDSGREEIRNLLSDRKPLVPVPASAEVKGLAGELHRAGLTRLALRWDPRSYPNDTPGKSLWSAIQARDFPRPAIRLGDQAWRQWASDFPPDSVDPRLLEALYPLPHPEELLQAVAGRSFLREPLLAAVAREESRWDPGALSAVGARGLLQLMPSTAQKAARREGIESPRPSDLFQRKLNLRLGASELENLLRHFDGFSPAAIAAYNAGTDQAELWKLQCGKNCPIENYVLMIGFDATRNYTADVLLAEAVYELRERNAALREPSAPLPATGESAH